MFDSITAIRLLLVVFTLVGSATAYAQDGTGRGSGAVRRQNPFSCSSAAAAINQAQGRMVLEQVQSHYSSIESMQGNFHQDSYVAALDEGEVSSGTMVFAKPGKMRWSYKTPRQQEVVIRDGELWMYQPDKGQVMIDSIGAVLLSALPVSFLMGIGNVTKDFDFVSACRTSAGIAVSLVPHKDGASTGKEEALEGFTLLVDETKNVPKGAKIISVGGNTTAIVFENLQLNVPGIAPGRFVLEYPKGVDILDRRSTPGS
jgi:outer membrane lipoprotein carrier protein